MVLVGRCGYTRGQISAHDAEKLLNMCLRLNRAYVAFGSHFKNPGDIEFFPALGVCKPVTADYTTGRSPSHNNMTAGLTSL